MITGKAPKVSKEPKFVGPDEVPMLPQYLVNQNPEEASGYHLQLKEWWESVHENLNRIRDLIVRFQVGELRQESTENLDSTKLLLLNYVNDLVDEANASIQQTAADQNGHAIRTDNPHSVTKTQVGLGNVTNADHATALSTHAGLTNNPHAVTAAQVSLGNVLNHASYAKTETYTKTEADSAISTALSTAGGQPGWNFVTQTTIYSPPALYGTYSNIDLHIFGANGIPADARYAMIGHQHNQGYCQVYVGGRATIGDTQWVMFGQKGDNHNGRSIIVVENMALPKLHYDEVYNGSSSVAYPNSDSHSNIIQEGRVRFNFGTHDNDGSGSTHVVKVIAYSY